MLLELINSDNLNLLKVGGAITGNSTQIAIKYFNSRPLPGKSREIVVISSYLKEKLSPLEYKAIYYHEEGHYVLKHNGNFNMDWKTKELQADNYSSNKVGARNVLTALLKIPSIIRTCEPLKDLGLKTMSETEYTKAINMFLNTIALTMQFRYDILKSSI
jgi:Zn-dependent protease with chaperone function